MTPFLYKRENRSKLKELQRAICVHLRGRWFFKGGNYETYVKPKTTPKISLTEELRNKKGYNQYLKLKYNF